MQREGAMYAPLVFFWRLGYFEAKNIMVSLPRVQQQIEQNASTIIIVVADPKSDYEIR